MGKRTANARRQYILDFARTHMGKVGDRVEDYRELTTVEEIVQRMSRLATDRSRAAHQRELSRLSDEVLGKIVACGLPKAAPEFVGTTMYRLEPRFIAHLEDSSGRKILEALATTVIVAATVDNIYNDLQASSAK